MIVTNVSQAEAKKCLGSSGSWNPIEDDSELIFFANIEGLIAYIGPHSRVYDGKVIIMFFNGLDYIERTVSTLIELKQQTTTRDSPLEFAMDLMTAKNVSRRGSATQETTRSHVQFTDMRFFFHLSICELVPGFSQDKEAFCTLATLVSTVVSKSGTVCTPRSLYIDDSTVEGAKEQPMRCMLRNFPDLEVRLGSGIH